MKRPGPIFQLKPIGVIHSPHQQAAGTPLQAGCADGVEGSVEVFPEFAAGLKDLKGFERLWLLFRFDRARETQLRVVPFLDKRRRGVFATRAPVRPNALGLSCVRLLGVRGRILRVAGMDVLDGTPLIDIKPYVPAFDAFPGSRAGWIGRVWDATAVADNRFEKSRRRRRA